MIPTLLNALVAGALSATLVSPASGQARMSPISIPMEAQSQWVIQDAEPNGSPFTEVDGRPAIHVRRGIAVWNNIQLRNGVVEADLKPTSANAGFLGLMFHVNGQSQSELVYVRFGHSGKPDALQYDPYLNGSITWQLHPESQSAAALSATQWTHLKIVFSGPRAEVFVDGDQQPSLVVPDLAGGNVGGNIGVFCLADGGYVSNLQVTPLPGTTYSPPSRTFEEGTLRRWEISPAFETRTTDPTRYPVSVGRWKRVFADPPGLVTVNKIYASYNGRPPPRVEIEAGRAPGKLVFLRSQIFSHAARSRSLSLGYSDNVVLFLNRHRVYSGNNALGYREPDHLGRLSLSDTVSLPLRRGKNELLIALSDFGGGWGLEAVLHR